MTLLATVFFLAGGLFLLVALYYRQQRDAALRAAADWQRRAERAQSAAARVLAERSHRRAVRSDAVRAAAAPAPMPLQAPTLGWRCPRCDGEPAR